MTRGEILVWAASIDIGVAVFVFRRKFKKNINLKKIDIHLINS